MAFFNLTMLGPQEPIKSAVRDTVPPQPTSTAGPFHDLRLTTPISSVRTDPASPQSPVTVVQARGGKEKPIYAPVTQPLYRPPTVPPVMSPGRGVTAVFSVGDTPPEPRPSGQPFTCTAQTPCLTTTVPAAGRPTAHCTMVKPTTPPAPAYRYLDEARNNGSYTKYMEIRYKHRRNPQGPNELYRYPLTATHEYGRWMLNDHPEKKAWAQQHRHGLVTSEMTRFVDEMSVTNKDFTLF